jgi:tetratricopeptide (TPR) repeat protein
MEKGNLDAARKQFLDVLKLRYGFMPAHAALVQISEKKQDYKEMLQQADQILQLDPGNSNARLWRGVALMGTRNYDQARSELTELVRSHPQFEDAELQLGLLDVDQNRLADAEAIFRKLYKPGQPDGRPLEGLVRTLTARKEPDKALPILAEALKKSPDSKAVRSQLAFVAATTGNTDLAIDQYTWLVEKDPGNIDHQVRLAEAYRAKGDFTSAAAAFQTAWKLAPKDIRIPTALASIQDANGQREQAKATYLEALKLDPDNPFILNNLAFMLADTNGNLEEAMGMLERAQRKQPNDPRISDTVGWVYLKKNLTDSAIQIFSSLVHKSPDDPNYRYHLALALLQKGDKARAREEFEIALEHHPGKDTADRIKQLIGKM